MAVCSPRWQRRSTISPDITSPPCVPRISLPLAWRWATVSGGSDASPRVAAGAAPTSVPWAVIFSNPNAVIASDRLNVPIHPTQLYEAFAEWAICGILLWFILRKHNDGQILGLYLLLYGAARFSIEFYREHDSLNPLGMGISLEQWIAACLSVAGLWLVVRGFGLHTARQPLGAAR